MAAKISNIRTYINASIKPFIVALRNIFQAQLEFLTKLAKRQDKSIIDAQAQIAKLQGNIVSYKNEVLLLKETVADLKNNITTNDQINEYIRRVRELTSICDSLYSLVIKNLPEEATASLPDFNQPFVYPIDLEKEWRNAGNITDEELNDDQLLQLKSYVDGYYRKYPNKKPPQDMLLDYGGSYTKTQMNDVNTDLS